ncbi:MAG TPA: cytochrome c biogenesis protein CcdA, partial [Flavisolibacter sp.]|nr:cytochrome c biogenesis protein CcdA [Flavisolibacter sp.]
MRRKNRLLVFLFTLFIITTAQAQNPVQFHFTQEASGNDVLLKIKAAVPQGRQLVSTKEISEEAPINTKISFDSSAKYTLKDSLVEKGTSTQQAEADFNNATVNYFTDSVEWLQKIQLTNNDSAVVKGHIAYFVKNNGSFNNYEDSFAVKVGKPVHAATVVSAQSKDDLESRSLGYIFLISFLGGFIALVTPCVFSMIPVTVGFFTKRSKDRETAIRNAAYYSISIILIFTLLGFLITLIFGPSALNKLATNWIANLLFFLIFLVFGISFLGAFDIQLPSSWQTAADS